MAGTVMGDDASSATSAEHYCDETADCDGGYVCASSTSKCTEDTSGGADQTYYGGNEYCETSNDCDYGYQCQEGQCVDEVRGPTPKPTAGKPSPAPTPGGTATMAGSSSSSAPGDIAPQMDDDRIPAAKDALLLVSRVADAPALAAAGSAGTASSVIAQQTRAVDAPAGAVLAVGALALVAAGVALR